MKKILLIILIVLPSLKLTAQETLSIRFSNATPKEALLQLEATTNYQFFFLDEWLNESSITANFENESIDTILSSLFEGTNLNYYLLEEGKIILTQNNLIYDYLPDNYFNERNINTTPVGNNPVEVVERINPVFNASDKSKRVAPIQTVRIGKATRANRNAKHTLTGIITDKAGNPLPNVAIVFEDKTIGTSSNTSGAYTIGLNAGTHLIQTRSLGHETLRRRVVIYDSGTLNLSLEESLEQLDEVLLEGKTNQNVVEANTGVTKVDVEEIKNIPLVLGERDILKVATTLPGISTAGEGSAGYNVRGGKEDQNLILLDDGVIYNPAHFFGIFSGINPFTTSEVEIYKGNIPAEYGGRLSSVVDIISKDANVENFAGEASIGPVTSSVALEIPLEKGKSGLMLGGRSTYSNWILRSLDEPSLQKSKANFYDVILKYNQKLGENDDLKATAYYSKDAFSITSDSLFNYSNRMVSLKWNHVINEKNSAQVGFTNSAYKFGIEFDENANTDFDFGYDISETGIKVKLNYKPNDKHKIDYGVASKLYRVNPGSISPINDSSITPLALQQDQGLESAVFISDEFKVSDKLLLSAGLRFSFYAALGASTQNIYQEGVPRSEATRIGSETFAKNKTIETYSGPEVRASARYLLGEDLSVKASYNSTFQYIHTLTNNTTVSPTDTWKLSDLNIKPQEAKQYSLGFFKNLEDNRYELSAEGYFKTSENILDFKTGAQLLLNETIETEVLQGEGQSYGLELLLRKNKGDFNGWLSYTYSRSLIKFESDFAEETINGGDFFPSNFDKPHDFSLVTNYKLTKRFSFSANLVYQTGRPVTVPVGNFVLNNTEFVLYSDRNEFRIPDYYRLDIGFNVEGNHKIKKFAHSFWNISIYNVLGRNNPYSVFFVTENGDVKAKQSSIFSVPVPTITYNFKF